MLLVVAVAGGEPVEQGVDLRQHARRADGGEPTTAERGPGTHESSRYIGTEHILLNLMHLGTLPPPEMLYLRIYESLPREADLQVNLMHLGTLPPSEMLYLRIYESLPREADLQDAETSENPHS
ncbi:hypothetical protein [Microbispora sp. H10949]|uniref:hypothetical protein n=1 Tax=Microbispora sp. H10949 TaxID=2729111 RepID=UPI0016039B5C|nr:hypothetical protein [Microbispora sp. H10949]